MCRFALRSTWGYVHPSNMLLDAVRSVLPLTCWAERTCSFGWQRLWRPTLHVRLHLLEDDERPTGGGHGRAGCTIGCWVPWGSAAATVGPPCLRPRGRLTCLSLVHLPPGYPMSSTAARVCRTCSGSAATRHRSQSRPVIVLLSPPGAASLRLWLHCCKPLQMHCQWLLLWRHLGFPPPLGRTLIGDGTSSNVCRSLSRDL